MKGKSPITRETLVEEEKLAGVEYTDAEREQILRRIEPLRQMQERRRSVKLPNPLGPATGFDPRLPGMTGQMECLMNLCLKTSGSLAGEPV